jgi:hypothetical protein
VVKVPTLSGSVGLLPWEQPVQPRSLVEVPSVVMIVPALQVDQVVHDPWLVDVENCPLPQDWQTRFALLDGFPLTYCPAPQLDQAVHEFALVPVWY